ncbi:pantetheine-phosphate adenylyltransferase family protein [Aspergillus heteromorphus CBS 117.55]|uniref:Pantetheine-phosphate adenylyltransferase family protein n=1 Tax=Aspergillus heteromorphus CBS 117.55 TaxID=1448321 RepID=A0A317WLU9_9EURO|nr:pantetheine-phosphate adenylyltransferase family protein [Aspergillus heteromorphus CBS 117.55]PWY86027.1 pantetheine-phosphate adenylyltransferase family protein [Aspergillus heteromorphus CBS 117.55]
MASDPTSALLLLPPPPSASFDQFKAAYEPILVAVCSKLAQQLDGANRTAILDIALSLPGLLSPSCQPQTRAFASLQSFLESIYRLIGIVCVELGLELDGPGGITARVILLDFDSVQTAAVTTGHPRDGPIVDLQTLAQSERPWERVYYPDNQVGRNLAAAFSSFQSQTKDPNAGSMHAIPDAPNWSFPDSLLALDDAKEFNAHYSVAVGGTFDHFHIGHKLLVTATALVLQPAEEAEPGRERKITVGVTGEGLLAKKKYAEFLESWDERCETTGAFLLAIMDFRPPDASAPRIERANGPGPDGKYIRMHVRPDLIFQMVQITDPFGPTITDEGISALVVSKETRAGGAAVNEERARKGWEGLEVFEVDVLHTGEVPTDDVENFASKISSTDIRRRRMEMAMATR